MNFDENSYEQALIEIFKQLDYKYQFGGNIEDRDFYSPLYESILREKLVKINNNLPIEAINIAIDKLKKFESPNLIENNILFMDYLQNGIEIHYKNNGIENDKIVYLIDYNNINNNSFLIVNQWTFVEKAEKRPDVILFLNGIPIVLFELKSLIRENVDISDGYNQIRNYMKDIPSMFIYNTFVVISDLITSKAGTITSSEDRFMEWKSIDGNNETIKNGDFNTFINGIFQKERLLDIIKNFICFSREGANKDKKILVGYHQYFAVKKAIESTKIAVETKTGKGGVFWHTQGSGKSLSMIFYAKLLQKELNQPTIVVVTDRNDLNNQLYQQFLYCKDYLRQTPKQAESRENLKYLLENQKVNGIIFTTMQKFEESYNSLSERRNIIVIADEAHRGQYGLTEKVNSDTGEIKIGIARIIRNTLPNATYIGFTGTPIAKADKNTREVFGDYIDIYDMTQSVEDGATKPIFYESRVIKLNLKQEILEKIDAEYDILSNKTDEIVIQKSKKELSQMEEVLGNTNTIDSLVKDIIQHYEENREHILVGKAMIVGYSRKIGIKIYHKILELRPNWNEKIAVVMTSSNNDPEEWKAIIGNKQHKKELEKEFKDENSKLKIVIVVDMWLTGFDVPCLDTMYVYKPMESYNLMQAIARVNRVFKSKEGGLVVDYIGIARALKSAMSEYTKRDRDNYGEMNISKTALPKFMEKIEVCRDLFNGFKYDTFISGSNLERATTIVDGINFLLSREKEKQKELYLKEALILHQTLTLCSSLVERELRIEATFFEAIRVGLIKLSTSGNNKKMSLGEINKQINELLKQSIKSDGVVNLFQEIEDNFSLFDPKFMEEISKIKQKNLSIEILKKLIEEQIHVYKRTNLVQSEKFSDLINKTLNKYLNGMLTNEEVIEELLKLAKEIIKVKDNENNLGLTSEELAFYDALTKPQAIKDVYENTELVAITRELTETLRKNKTINWRNNEFARAKMKVIVKKLLKKYKYPPEKQEEALDTVIKQCELWADNDGITN